VNNLLASIEYHLGRVESGWSIGIFGAVAEFRRDPKETACRGHLSMATARGAIRLTPPSGGCAAIFGLRSRRLRNASPGIALCVADGAARQPYRETVTELGPDAQAVRSGDREGVLFDLGLGSPYAAFCVRLHDQAAIARLRGRTGQKLLAPGGSLFSELVEMSPTRVVISRMGRIEVFQPIAAPGGSTPPGPHTHLLPRLARTGRTHDANLLLPSGLVPCAVVYPSEGVH
jgi:hypothetical protein